jgi:hypothetical protein
MRIRNPLPAALVIGTLFLGGCAKDHVSTTGSDNAPGDAATHYDGAVNSTGSPQGRDDPAINSAAPSATGTHITGGTGPMMNGGGGSSSPAGTSSTSDQNGGGGVPSGGTGTAGH